MNIYSIYKATNNITNKCYIGFDSNWPTRKSQHKRAALISKKPYTFYNSIRKHGWDNFTWEIIYQSKDKLHTLEYMENYFICQFNSFTNGYNMTTGGESGLLSNEVKKKISDKLKGRSLSDITKNKMKGRMPWNKGLTGKPLTEEHKQKLITANKTRKHNKHSEATKQIIKEKRANQIMVPRVKKECPHCHRMIDISTINRWHMDNCKLIKQS